VTNIRNTLLAALARLAEAGKPLSGAVQQLRRVCVGAEPWDRSAADLLRGDSGRCPTMRSRWWCAAGTRKTGLQHGG